MCNSNKNPDIDKVDEVDLSRKSSHTTHHHHLNVTSLFLSFPAPFPLPSSSSPSFSSSQLLSYPLLTPNYTSLSTLS